MTHQPKHKRIVRSRTRDYLRAAWCAAFDWLEPLGSLYRSDKRGPVIWLASKAQIAWFRAHNNRVYEWLDERPGDSPSPPKATMSLTGPTTWSNAAYIVTSYTQAGIQ